VLEERLLGDVGKAVADTCADQQSCRDGEGGGER
jgi:hypothetical protein